MKISNLKYVLPLLILTTGCTRNLGNQIPPGRYCGSSNQEFPNPFANENLNESEFTILTSNSFKELAPLADMPKTYRAQSVRLYYKNNNFTPLSTDGTFKPDQVVMLTHGPVFTNSEISLNNFTMSCARGVELDSSSSFEAIIPIEIQVKSDLSWSSMQALNYRVEYGPDPNSEEFLNVRTVEELTSPAPADAADFAFEEYVFLEQIGKLSKVQKAMKEDPVKALNEIFMQIKVSTDPEVYARIAFVKFELPADTAKAPEVEETVKE